jgi:hypothetical protein
MTPSPTMTPSPNNAQPFSIDTMTLSTIGDGGAAIFSNVVTLSYVPQFAEISCGAFPSGIGGPVTYRLQSSLSSSFVGTSNFVGPNSVSDLTSLSSFRANYAGRYWRVVAINVTPTPNVTPISPTFLFQSKR